MPKMLALVWNDLRPVCTRQDKTREKGDLPDTFWTPCCPVPACFQFHTYFMGWQNKCHTKVLLEKENYQCMLHSSIVGSSEAEKRMKANQFGSCCEASNIKKHIVHCSMNTVHVSTVDIKFLHCLRLEQPGMARLLSNHPTVLPVLVCPSYQHQWLACPPTLHTSTSGH